MSSYDNDAMQRQFADLRTVERFANARMEELANPFWPHGPGYLITLPDVPLPAGWSHDRATLAFWMRAPYMPPDGFWTHEDVKLRDDGHDFTPQWTRSGYINPVVVFPPGCKMHWWRSPTIWSPNGDNLTTAARFMHLRFRTLE